MSAAEMMYRAELDLVTDAALDWAATAWGRAMGMPAAEREAYLLAALADIAELHGDVAAAAAVDYVRAVTRATGEVVAVTANSAQVEASMSWALQTQRAGLSDPAVAATLQPRIRGAMLKLVRLRAHETVDRAAREQGRERTVKREPGACAFCIGRSGHEGAVPPFHDGCRCDVTLV